MKKWSLLLLTMAMSSSAFAGELVFSSWGGAYQDAIRHAWLTPFSKETGIEITEDTDPQIAKIKAMEDTNSMVWDVVSGGGVGMIRGEKMGLFEKITPDMVDESDIMKPARSDYGIPSEIYSNLVAYSTKAFPKGKPHPVTFADFWNVKKFPGKRTLPNKPETVLEAALMADGVPVNKVYDVLSTKKGLDRAFNKVKELLPYVSVFWSSSAQPVQMLGSGEVVMAFGSNGRFQNGIDNGLPIKMSWANQVPQVGYMMIPKGAPDKAEALKFFNYVAKAKNNARLSEYVSYGPVTNGAWDYIDEKRASRLPSAPKHMKNAVFIDTKWWSEHSKSVTERYLKLIQG
ncbi:ABC transporter substrate-binding protein [Celerinatantimonas sp. MCCC 1A17872]|uniref:ABC transporter substrate-binding protein n=1 Tax=Celerinatantimonas sp. MCCC 1A17872 TaxID=3177514 RepID=UPI0038C589BD